MALFTDDIFVSMPPIPLEYEGLDAVTRFYTSVIRPNRKVDLVPTRANGQPAFGMWQNPNRIHAVQGTAVVVAAVRRRAH